MGNFLTFDDIRKFYCHFEKDAWNSEGADQAGKLGVVNEMGAADRESAEDESSLATDFSVTYSSGADESESNRKLRGRQVEGEKGNFERQATKLIVFRPEMKRGEHVQSRASNQNDDYKIGEVNMTNYSKKNLDVRFLYKQMNHQRRMVKQRVLRREQYLVARKRIMDLKDKLHGAPLLK